MTTTNNQNQAGACSELLTLVANSMNHQLAAAGRDERWTCDNDTFSNSCGTWFCGTMGGVSDETTMREETGRICASAQAATTLYYFTNGTQVLVNHEGDETLMTPQDALANGADLHFCWCPRAGADILLGAWKHMGVAVEAATLEDFMAKGGIFAEAVSFYQVCEKEES